MPPIFVDTSAIYALLDASDESHALAAAVFPELREATPTTHNYVVVESIALAQARLGAAAVRRLLDDLLPVMAVVWVGEALHRQGVAGLLASRSRSISFVDQISFAFMRAAGVRRAFAFDDHFRREGFALLGATP